MERTLLITVKLKNSNSNWRMEDMAGEMEELAATSGASVVEHIQCSIERPTSNLFIGKGKVEEIAMLCGEENIETVILNVDLTGTQQRNLEDALGRKTIDRTQLILDIFARHAKSPEGKMQVELAQLQYLLPRLTGKGVILSRLGGGIGTRGPGETKLETDRRRIRSRIDKLKSDLRQVTSRRQVLRKNRKEHAIPIVALVGYTNAGKSTLINAITKSNQVVADSLFTTLDPLNKNFVLPCGENIVISDTVGFLNELPHHLIEAFKATLEEVVQADLLIHVLDVNHPRIYEHSQAVFKVLSELGVKDKPTITALNKIDILDDLAWLQRLKKDFVNPVAISAKYGTNFDQLFSLITENFADRMVKKDILIPHTRMDLMDLFYREGKVIKVEYLPEGIKVNVNIPRLLYDKLLNNKQIGDIN